MRQAYPTFIAQSGSDFLVCVPDMDLYTEGKSVENAIDMARDTIGRKGIDLEDDGKTLPTPSDYQGALLKAQEDTEDFDYSKGLLTLVDVDFAKYRRQVDNRMIRRNVTLPYWLNVAADQLNLNVSKVLQDALAIKVSELRKEG